MTIADIKHVNEHLVRRIHRTIDDDGRLLRGASDVSKVLIKLGPLDFTTIVDDDAVGAPALTEVDLNSGVVRLRGGTR